MILAERRAKLRERYYHNIGKMGIDLFPKSFKEKYGIPWFACYIWWVLQNHLRVVIKLPRRHAKSSFVTFLYVMWCVLFKRKKFIVIYSANAQLAMRFLNRIRNYLTSRPVQALFGAVDAKYDPRYDDMDEIVDNKGRKTSQWNTRGLITAWGQTIIATGIFSSKRGLISVDDRPDLIILDDVEDRKNTNTPELRQKLLEILYEEIIPMGTDVDELQIIVIGTICHNGSIILKLAKGDIWYVVPIDRATYPMTDVQALNEGVPDEYKFKPNVEYFSKDISIDGVEYKKGDPAPEVSIWQKRYSYELIRGFMEQDYRDRGMLSSFWQEMYNIPKSKEFRIFTEFRYTPEIKFRNRYGYKILESETWTFPNGKKMINVETFAGVDLAISEASGADWRVVFPIAVDPYDNRYLFPPYYSKEKPVSFTTKVFERHLFYRFKNVGFDSIGYQETWQHLARHMMGRWNDRLKRNIPYMNTKPIPRYRDKYDSIEAVMDRVWSRTYLCGTPAEFEIFENEMRELRYADHEDQADACTYANMVARPPEEVDFDQLPPILEQSEQRPNWRKMAREQNRIPKSAFETREWELR